MKFGNYEIASLLLLMEPDTEVRNRDKKTPFDYLDGENPIIKQKLLELSQRTKNTTSSQI